MSKEFIKIIPCYVCEKPFEYDTRNDSPGDIMGTINPCCSAVCARDGRSPKERRYQETLRYCESCKMMHGDKTG